MQETGRENLWVGNLLKGLHCNRECGHFPVGNGRPGGYFKAGVRSDLICILESSVLRGSNSPPPALHQAP